MRLTLAIAQGLALAGCAATGIPGSAQRYDWGGYDTALYNVYTDPGTVNAVVARLDKHVARLEQGGQKVPPGLYADLGSLCLQVGDRARSQAYYRKERALWPESAVLMDALTGASNAQATAASAPDARPHSILVVPPLNRSVNPSAADFVATTLGAPLAQKGYYVFPMHTARLVLEQQGFRNAEQLQAKPAQELARTFGADAVLFVTVNRWEQRATLASDSALVIDLDYRLVDKDGKELWKTRKQASVSSQDRIGGTQMSEAMRDTMGAMMPMYTKSSSTYVPLARSTNAQALVTDPGMLPDGPYGMAPP